MGDLLSPQALQAQGLVQWFRVPIQGSQLGGLLIKKRMKIFSEHLQP